MQWEKVMPVNINLSCFLFCLNTFPVVFSAGRVVLPPKPKFQLKVNTKLDTKPTKELRANPNPT